MFAGSRDRTRGYASIVLAAVLFGIWPTLSKLVLGDVHPLAIAFLIQLIPGLALAPAVRQARVARSDWTRLLLSAILGSVVAPVVYLYGLDRTTASNSVLLSNSESLFTIVLAYAFLAERASRREYIAVAGIASGAFLVATQLRFGDVRFAEFLLGNVMLVGAAACWGASNTLSTILLRRIPIRTLLAHQFLIGAGIVGAIVAVSGVPLAVPVSVVPILVLLSLGAVGGFAMLFFYAFRTIGAIRTGTILTTSALWGILVALAVLPNETLSEVQILGGALMIGSLVLLYLVRGRPTAAVKGETLKPVASDGPDSP